MCNYQLKWKMPKTVCPTFVCKQLLDSILNSHILPLKKCIYVLITNINITEYVHANIILFMFCGVRQTENKQGKRYTAVCKQSGTLEKHSTANSMTV